MKDNEKYYYPIDEGSAKAAKNANSFNKYIQGSATREYQRSIDFAVDLAEKQKQIVDPSEHEKIDKLLDRYCRKLAENINDCNRIRASVPSVMISGAGNFSVRKKEKQNEQFDRNMKEYKEIENLLEKIKSTGTGGISSDDKNAIQKLQEKLEKLQALQEQGKEFNKYYRKHQTLVGFDGLSDEQAKKLDEEIKNSLHKVPMPRYALSNNNQNMASIKKRIESLKQVENISDDSGWKFDGGEVVLNKEENRVQLLFDEKPSEEMRSKLKHSGFKWAPSQKAWQRMLNGNGIYAAKKVTSEINIPKEKGFDR